MGRSGRAVTGTTLAFALALALGLIRVLSLACTRVLTLVCCRSPGIVLVLLLVDFVLVLILIPQPVFQLILDSSFNCPRSWDQIQFLCRILPL